MYSTDEWWDIKGMSLNGVNVNQFTLLLLETECRNTLVIYKPIRFHKSGTHTQTFIRVSYSHHIQSCNSPLCHLISSETLECAPVPVAAAAWHNRDTTLLQLLRTHVSIIAYITTHVTLKKCAIYNRFPRDAQPACMYTLEHEIKWAYLWTSDGMHVYRSADWFTRKQYHFNI